MSRPESVSSRMARLRLQHGHLEHLVAFLLAAAEALVDRPIEQALVDVQHLDLLLDQGQEVHGVEFLQAAVPADGVDSRLEEVRVAHSWDLDGVLEGQEDALAGPFLRGHVQQVLAQVENLSLSRLVGFPAGKHLGQGALAGAVGTHDGVDLAGVDRQIDAAQDLLAIDARVQVPDFQHCFVPSLWFFGFAACGLAG